MSKRAAVLVVFALAACTERGSDVPSGDETGPAGGSASTAAPGDSTRAPLISLNRSTVSGSVRSVRTEGAVVVVIEAEGFSEPGEYAAYVFQGECGAGGESTAVLNPLVAMADSAGASTTILDPAELPADPRLSIQLRGRGDAPVACGNLR